MRGALMITYAALLGELVHGISIYKLFDINSKIGKNERNLSNFSTRTLFQILKLNDQTDSSSEDNETRISSNIIAEEENFKQSDEIMEDAGTKESSNSKSEHTLETQKDRFTSSEESLNENIKQNLLKKYKKSNSKRNNYEEIKKKIINIANKNVNRYTDDDNEMDETEYKVDENEEDNSNDYKMFNFYKDRNVFLDDNIENELLNSDVEYDEEYDDADSVEEYNSDNGETDYNEYYYERIGSKDYDDYNDESIKDNYVEVANEDDLSHDEFESYDNLYDDVYEDNYKIYLNNDKFNKVDNDIYGDGNY